MCGRYNILPNTAAWLAALDILGEWNREHLDQPRYNIAPTSQVPVLLHEEGQMVGRMMRWGFVPSWVKEEKPRLVNNARAETVSSSGYFKRAFTKQRCIFPASGFYEWRATATGKQPFNIVNADGSPLLMAGVWDLWRDQFTAAIITTTPNATMAPIHDRMPVMVPDDCIHDWLTTDMPEHYLRPAPDTQLRAYPVSTRVNSVRNDDAGLVEEQLESAIENKSR